MLETLFGEILTTPAGCTCSHSAVIHGVGGGCRGGGCMCGWERDSKGVLSERATNTPASELGKARKSILEKLRKQGIRCHYCGGQAESRDHIVPRSRGGSGSGNVAWACLRCNQMKADMTVEEFLAQCRKVLAFRDSQQSVPVV